MSTPHTLESVKQGISALCATAPNVHVDLAFAHLKLCCENEAATLRGAYRYVFTLEEHLSGRPVCHTFQYTDVLTGRITIHELNT